MTSNTTITMASRPRPAPTGKRPLGRERPVTAVLIVAVAMGIGLITAGMAFAGSGVSEVASVTTVASTTATSNAAEAGLATSGTEVDTASALTGLVDVSDIAAGVVDSVVTVNVTIDVRGPGELTGSGSGIVLTADGTIVTNAHVVAEATSLSVTLTDGSELAAEVVGIDTGQDVAVLAIEATGLLPVTIGTTVGLEVGDPVMAVGNPLGLEGGPSVTTGIVSALGRVLEDSNVHLEGVIQTDAAITEGSSGGALFDGQGRLIGITTAVGVSNIGVEGIGFAIPVETVMLAVDALTGL